MPEVLGSVLPEVVGGVLALVCALWALNSLFTQTPVRLEAKNFKRHTLMSSPLITHVWQT